MESRQSTGLICLKSKTNIEFVVCRLDYIVNEDETYKFIFTPYYDVIDLLDSSFFQGIPGIEVQLRKEHYIRENFNPVFISERVPSINRDDYFELLDSVGLDYMDPIKYLIKTKYKYSGDNFYLKEFKEREKFTLNDKIGKANSFGIIKLMLDNISCGNYIYLSNGTCLNNKAVFDTLNYLYEIAFNDIQSKQELGIRKAKESGKYKGRKPIDVDIFIFLDQLEKLENGSITLNEVLKKLNISKATFYRLKKKYQK